MAGEAYLPPEIITEILSRLEAKSILVLKRVCKMWRSIIEDRHFVKMQMSRAKSRYVLVESLYEDGYGKDFLVEALNGLLLEMHQKTNKLSVRNPATKARIDLPDPHHKPSIVTLLIHLETSDNYKVVSFFGKEGDGFGGCQVLTLGMDHLAWRNLEIPSLRHLNDRQFNRFLFVFTDNVAYIMWLSDFASGTTARDIVCIDMETEGFETVTAPEGFFASWDSVWPIEWEDNLSLYKAVGQDLHVWVLEDYKNRKWAESKIVISLSFLSKHASISHEFYPSCLIKGWLYISANGIYRICYNVKSGSWESIFDVPDTDENTILMRFTLVNPYALI